MVRRWVLRRLHRKTLGAKTSTARGLAASHPYHTVTAEVRRSQRRTPIANRTRCETRAAWALGAKTLGHRALGALLPRAGPLRGRPHTFFRSTPPGHHNGVATARIRQTLLEIRRWVVGRWVTPTEADRGGALLHINGCTADGGTGHTGYTGSSGTGRDTPYPSFDIPGSL